MINNFILFFSKLIISIESSFKDSWNLLFNPYFLHPSIFSIKDSRSALIINGAFSDFWYWLNCSFYLEIFIFTYYLTKLGFVFLFQRNEGNSNKNNCGALKLFLLIKVVDKFISRRPTFWAHKNWGSKPKCTFSRDTTRRIAFCPFLHKGWYMYDVHFEGGGGSAKMRCYWAKGVGVVVTVLDVQSLFLY